MSVAEFLVDTSALVRLLRNPELLAQWERSVTDGLVATCTVTEIELLYTARSRADIERQKEKLRELFTWVVMPDGSYEEAEELQVLLADKGAHRSAGTVDLLTAVTAGKHGLTLLHYDRDFVRVSEVTGQPVQWVAEPGTVS